MNTPAPAAAGTPDRTAGVPEESDRQRIGNRLISRTSPDSAAVGNEAGEVPAATQVAGAVTPAQAATGVAKVSESAAAQPITPARSVRLAAVPDALAHVGSASADVGQFDPLRLVSDLVNGLWNGVRRLNYTFFNEAPTLNPTLYLEDPDTGVITGNLGASDPNGDIITYIVDVSPLHGILDIAEDGSYTYIPDIATTQYGALDTFTVRAVDNTFDNPWHVHLINDVVNGLNRIAYDLFGVQPFPDKSVATVMVEVSPAINQTRPGLISSDWLKVIKTTGENWPYEEDEPVMLTMVLQTVAGYKNSTSTTLVNYGPSEIGEADEGQSIRIPDSDGDVWIRSVDPMTFADIEKATEAGVAIPIPVVSVVTLMLEGDRSSASDIGDMGKTLLPTYNKVGLVVESTEFKSLDVAEDVKKMLTTIAAEVTPSTAQIVQLVLTRIGQWVTSGFDPDDPVGAGVTVLIPVDATVVELFDSLGGPTALGLDSQWMFTTTYELRNALFDANIPIRVGFLVPPSSLPNGTVQNWKTTYAGDYLDNDWAEWEVETQAWPTINW